MTGTDERFRTPLRFAYADPPYPGQAHQYRKHPDYGGEVDHAALVADLAAFDGWALSTSVKALPAVLALCPRDVLTLAWIKPMSPPMGDHRIYSWEPVILHGGRTPTLATRLHLICNPPGYFGRRVETNAALLGPEHVIGEKPAAFSRWLFAAAGLDPADEFVDLFPGSGAVGDAWRDWCAQGRLIA